MLELSRRLADNRLTMVPYPAAMLKIAIVPALFVVFTACGSDGDSTSESPSADASTPATAAADPTTAPAASNAQESFSPGCDSALGEAENLITGVMDALDAAEPVDPDEVSAAFGAVGEAVGGSCGDTQDGAVSRLITFTSDEGSTRSIESQGFIVGFLSELCTLPTTLTSSAADACAAAEQG